MKLLTIGVVLLLGGCGSATMRSEFTPFGAVGSHASAGPIVTSVDQVQVFYASSPAGFSLRENELTVEPGYSHRILGIVKLQLDIDGFCKLTQKDALDRMQFRAFTVGANAVVYATSPLAQTENRVACNNAAKESNFGSGWAVVLGAAAETAPAAAPVAAPAGVAPAAAPATPPRQ